MNHAVKLPLALVLLVLTHQDPAAAVVRGIPNQLVASPLLQADHAQPLIVISQTGPAEGEGSELVGTAWRLVAIGVRDAIEGVQSVLNFERSDRVSGSGGCNGFFGGLEISEGSIDFGPLGATQMACGDAIDDQEYRLFQALEKARSYATEKNLLLIMDDDGKELLRLRRM